MCRASMTLWRRETRSRWILQLVAILVSCPAALPQNDGRASELSRQPILEVVEISGPDWWEDRYLYLRLFLDGRAEFQDPRKIDLTKEMPAASKKLSEQDREKLMTILSSKETRELSGIYEKENIGNIRSILMIEIERSDGKQHLEFVNFDSDRAMEGGRAYTPAAERFGSIIRKAREDSLEKRPLPSESKQSTTEALDRGVILEVLATDYQLYTQKKFVYARVFENAWVEYQDRFHADLLHPTIIRKRLSASEFAQLKDILTRPAVRQLSGEYQGWSGVDTSVRWDFSIPDSDKIQRFVLWNFTYPKRWRPADAKPIPKAADELGCFLMRIDEENLHLRGMPDRCKEADSSN